MASDSENEEASIPSHLQEDTNALSYKYRDFANVPEEIDNDAGPQRQPNRGHESSIRVQKFPVKLYAILRQKEFADIITWMPHGRSWKVLKPNLFESLIMPLFFEYSNYHSFNRLVNAWSFRRVSSGPDRGSYYHELFLRGKPHLQKYMRRLPKTHKKLPMKKEDEPDFYELDKSSPLPEVEDAPGFAAAGMMAMARRGPSLGMNPQMNQLTSSYPGFFNKSDMKDATMMPPMGGPMPGGIPPGMAGMGAFGAPGMGTGAGKVPGQGAMGGAGDMPDDPQAAQLWQLQRMRHMQHIQMFQQQLGAISQMPPGPESEAARRAVEAAHLNMMAGGVGGIAPAASASGSGTDKKPAAGGAASPAQGGSAQV